MIAPSTQPAATAACVRAAHRSDRPPHSRLRSERMRRSGSGTTTPGTTSRSTSSRTCATAGHDVDRLRPPRHLQRGLPRLRARRRPAVAAGEVDRGIVICGSGVGISIAANKVAGIRAVLCSEPYTAALSRLHNDSNVLALGARASSASASPSSSPTPGWTPTSKVDATPDVSARSRTDAARRPPGDAHEGCGCLPRRRWDSA